MTDRFKGTYHWQINVIASVRKRQIIVAKDATLINVNLIVT